MTYLAQVQETAEWIQAHTALRPQTAIVLGTGLGKLAQEIDVVDEFPYKDILNLRPLGRQTHYGARRTLPLLRGLHDARGNFP